MTRRRGVDIQKLCSGAEAGGAVRRRELRRSCTTFALRGFTLAGRAVHRPTGRAVHQERKSGNGVKEIHRASSKVISVGTLLIVVCVCQSASSASEDGPRRPSRASSLRRADDLALDPARGRADAHADRSAPGPAPAALPSRPPSLPAFRPSRELRRPLKASPAGSLASTPRRCRPPFLLCCRGGCRSLALTARLALVAAFLLLPSTLVARGLPALSALTRSSSGARRQAGPPRPTRAATSSARLRRPQASCRRRRRGPRSCSRQAQRRDEVVEPLLQLSREVVGSAGVAAMVVMVWFGWLEHNTIVL